MKIVMLWQSGTSDVRVPYQKEKNAVLKNIALTNWQAVANDVLLHSELRQDIVKALCRKLSVNAELKNIKELVVVHKFFG